MLCKKKGPNREPPGSAALHDPLCERVDCECTVVNVACLSSPLQYPSKCGEYAIKYIRDLTTGYDNSQPNNKAVSIDLTFSSPTPLCSWIIPISISKFPTAGARFAVGLVGRITKYPYHTNRTGSESIASNRNFE